MILSNRDMKRPWMKIYMLRHPKVHQSYQKNKHPKVLSLPGISKITLKVPKCTQKYTKVPDSGTSEQLKYLDEHRKKQGEA